jgi:hypothetical protein
MKVVIAYFCLGELSTNPAEKSWWAYTRERSGSGGFLLRHVNDYVLARLPAALPYGWI